MGRKIGINKIKAGFSVDIDIYNELDQYCDISLVNKSRLVSKLIKEFLEKNKIEKDVKN